MFETGERAATGPASKSDTSPPKKGGISMRNDNRKPHTLFGSGQHGANRLGRGPANDTPSMEEIVNRPLKLRDSEGRKVRTTLGELTEKALYREAVKNTKGARAELFRRYHEEQLCAIDRPKRKRASAKEQELAQALNDWTARVCGPILEILAELEGAGVIVTVAGERFIADWAARAATAATIERNTLRK